MQLVRTLPEIKAKLRSAGSGASPSNSKTVVLGFFDISEEEALGRDDTAVAEGYGLTPWGQFQAAADALRGLVCTCMYTGQYACQVVYVWQSVNVYRL